SQRRHSAASCANGEPGWVCKAYVANSAANTGVATRMGAAPDSQPIGCVGCRVVISAPTVEMVVNVSTYSTRAAGPPAPLVASLPGNSGKPLTAHSSNDMAHTGRASGHSYHASTLQEPL